MKSKISLGFWAEMITDREQSIGGNEVEDGILEKLQVGGCWGAAHTIETANKTVEQTSSSSKSNLSKHLPASTDEAPAPENILTTIGNYDLEDIKNECESWNESNTTTPLVDIHIEHNGVMMTPLHAALSREEEVFKYLLENQKFSDVLIEHRFRFIVHHCVQNTLTLSDYDIENRVNILELLKKYCADLLHNENEAGIVPLMLPNVHPELGLALTTGCSSGDAREFPNFLHSAADKYTPQQYHKLVQKIPKNKLKELFSLRDNLGRTSLHLAVLNMELEEQTLDLLIGADFNAVDNKSKSILFYAVEYGRSTEFLDILVKRGALGHLVDDEGNTILHCAATKGNEDAAKYIVKTFPGLVFEKNKKGYLPISLSLESEVKSFQCVEAMLDAGVMVTSIPYLELTAMKCEDRWEVFKLLVGRGYNLDGEGNCILHKCLNLISPSDYHELVVEVLKAGRNHLFSKRNTGQRVPLHEALLHVEIQERTLRLLHEAGGIDFNVTDEKGNSVLFYAVQGGRSLMLVQSLLEKGVKVEGVNAEGNNLLHWAVKYGNELVAKYLKVRFPALVEQVNSEGQTPLQVPEVVNVNVEVAEGTGSGDSTEAGDNTENAPEVVDGDKAQDASTEQAQTPVVSETAAPANPDVQGS